MKIYAGDNLMTTTILVTYTTNAGSTAEVAQAIGEELTKSGVQVEVRSFADVTSLDDYTAVIIGAPMILGWHRAAMAFVQTHQTALSQKPVAYFLTCLSLTATEEQTLNDVPLYLDTAHAKTPKNPGKLSFKEKFGLPASYVEPILGNAPQVKPVSVGLFGGKLDYSKLNLFQMLFVRIIIRHQAGDFRHWDAIKEWAKSLPALFKTD
jgi:menaquinone-dependent protoporphyrinogen oxidase